MSKENKIDNILDLMRRDESVDAPADAVKWAKNLYATRERKPSLLQRIAGVLQMDLTPDKAVLGERSAGAGHSRQIFFTAGEFGIDLRVTGDTKLKIAGQILGEGFENAEVKLSGPGGVHETSTSGFAFFEVSKVKRGKYELKITASVAEIVVDQIEL